MIKARGDFIGGKWVRRRHPDRIITSTDPGDCDVVLGEFSVHDAAVDEALEAARAGLPGWAGLEVQARVAALQKLRAELRNRSAELVQAISDETGRPRWDARDEVQAMHGDLDALLQASLAELSVCTSPPGGVRVTFRPLGVVVVISPHPQSALLLHQDTVAALAAGCTVVCKPSEHTPATAQLYAEIISEADLPRGVFNLIQGDGSTGEALAVDPRADGVLFCGSRAVGRRVAALQGGDKMVRTLVSADACALVLDDARLDEAALQIVIGACLSAGQRCTSTHRVVVHRRVVDPLCERLTALLEGLKVGHPGGAPEPFMGPLIGAPQLERYLGDLQRVGLSGAQELAHGAPLSSSRRGFYATPALFRAAAETAPELSKLEVAGPLLVLIPADDLDEGVTLLGQGGGLVTSVFCRGRRELEQVQRSQQAGLCLQNLPTTFQPQRVPVHPWGDRGGNGRPGGTLTARCCSRVVVDVEHEGALDVTMLPPGLPRAL